MANSVAPMMIISSLSSVGTGIAQSRALSAEGAVKKSNADINAKLSNLQADRTLAAGDVAASRMSSRTKTLVGEYRARAGGSGVNVNSGSNAIVQNEIQEAGDTDEDTIRSNAARTAWGYKVQALQDAYAGRVSQQTASNQAEQTLLTSGLKAVENPISIYSSNRRRRLAGNFND